MRRKGGWPNTRRWSQRSVWISLLTAVHSTTYYLPAPTGSLFHYEKIPFVLAELSRLQFHFFPSSPGHASFIFLRNLGKPATEFYITFLGSSSLNSNLEFATITAAVSTYYYYYFFTFCSSDLANSLFCFEFKLKTHNSVFFPQTAESRINEGSGFEG